MINVEISSELATIVIGYTKREKKTLFELISSLQALECTLNSKSQIIQLQLYIISKLTKCTSLRSYSYMDDLFSMKNISMHEIGPFPVSYHISLVIQGHMYG